MTARSPSTEERTELVVVRLSQIPPPLREKVALRLVEAWERHGLDPSEWLRVAAITANPDVKLEVPRWKAELVLAGKQPNGEMPKDLLW